MAEPKAKEVAPIPHHEIRIIAALSWTTERSVRNFLAGKPQKPILQSRIAATLRSQGYDP